MQLVKDRVGLGYRHELMAEILTHLDVIDVVEVIVDDWLKKSKRELGPLETLNAQVPVLYHGVTLGMASVARVDGKRLDAMARVLDTVKADNWSEHLAFVRAGCIEIGHLAAPPRHALTLEATAENVAKAVKLTGITPALENIATLLAPPTSMMDEAAWSTAVLQSCDAPLLLDLHNVYANAVNTGVDPFDLVRRYPLARTEVIHMPVAGWSTSHSSTARHWADDWSMITGTRRQTPCTQCSRRSQQRSIRLSPSCSSATESILHSQSYSLSSTQHAPPSLADAPRGRRHERCGCRARARRALL